MTTTSMNPGSRPRRGVAAVLAATVGLALVAAVLVALPADEAAASELRAFSSCDELAEWGEQSWQAEAEGDAASDGGETFSQVGAAVEAEEAAGAPATTIASDSASTGASGGDDSGGDEGGDTTNVAVEGVDELDLIDRLDTDVYLVATGERLSVVDLAAGEVRAALPVAADAQITYDRERGVAWVVGAGLDGQVVVERIAVGDDSLSSEGRWETTGTLVDARRVGGQLHLVATEGFPLPATGGGAPEPGFDGEGAPLTGTVPDSAVPEEPVGEALPAPETTTVPTTTAPATTVPGAAEPGPSDPEPREPEVTEPEIVEPEPEPDPTEPEIVEPEPEPDPEPEPEVTEPVEPEPTIPFTEGPVPCDEVLHPVGPSSPEATLLVTLPATGDLEPTHAAEVVGAGSQVHVTQDAAYLATTHHDGEPATGLHRFDLATLTPTGSGRVEGVLLDEFSMSEHDGHLRVAVTTGFQTFAVDDVGEVPSDDGPGSPAGDPRNEIVVLDTDGDLDVVGRTARFGKPGESIYGIRFTGDTAYAVTFLETDPFYVVDLSDPAAPEVTGEVELPGFSSYLHPLSPSLVVGFGPGEDGRATAKLFDVSDPTAPRVASDLSLGDESAVVWDHHAFVDLGDGRFAVPATTWSETVRSEVVVIDASSGTLEEVERTGAPGTDTATRVLITSDGWALLGWDRVQVLDGAGGVEASIALR